MKKLKIILSLVIAVCLVATMLSACSGGKNAGGDTSSTKGEGSTTATEAAETTASDDQNTSAGGNITLTHFLNHSWATQEFWGKDDISKAIEAKIGMQIKLSKPTTDDNQQINLMLASDNLPDLITIDLGNPTRQKIEKSGRVAEITPLIEKVDPSFKAYMTDEYFDICRSDDGKNYYYASCIFTHATFKQYQAVGPWNPALLVREDIWNGLGKPDITTPDGLFNTFMQVKEKYPEVTPLNFGTSLQKVDIINAPYDIRWILSNFGVEHYYTTSENRVVGAYNDPKYLDGMKYVNKLYKNGIITKEQFTQDSTKAKSNIESGKSFMFVGGVVDAGKVPSGNTKVRYILAPCMTATKGMQQVDIGWAATFISKKSTQKEAAAKYMQYMLSEEGNKIAQWGIEGRDWNIDAADGKAYFTPEFMSERAKDYATFQKKTGFRLYYWGINYWDHVIEGNMMSRDENMKSSVDLYGPYFGARMDYLTLQPDPASKAGLLLQRCKDAYGMLFTKAVFADDEAGVVKGVEDIKAEMKKIGIETVEEAWTERANKWKKIFNDDYITGYGK